MWQGWLVHTVSLLFEQLVENMSKRLWHCHFRCTAVPIWLRVSKRSKLPEPCFLSNIDQSIFVTGL